MRHSLRNKLTSVFICIGILICVFSACGVLQSEYRPALWQVVGPNGEEMYIMGSIHIGEESMYPFDQRIDSAFEKCDSLAVEYDIVSADERAENWTDGERIMYLSQYTYKDGDNIRNHLSKETYNEAKAYLVQKGVYTEQMDLFVPAFWQSIVNSLIVEDSGYNTEMGVDRVLIKLAREVGKQVLEIESEQSQLEMTLSFQDIVYDDSISEMIESKDSVSMQYAYMIDLWKRGRDDLIDRMTNDLTFLYSGSDDEAYAKAYEEYNDKMITERNINMADVADGYMKDGKKVFFVVGAAHVCGDGGIIDLLEEKGYTVNRM